jgi:hypothetical protein
VPIIGQGRLAKIDGARLAPEGGVPLANVPVCPPTANRPGSGDFLCCAISRYFRERRGTVKCAGESDDGHCLGLVSDPRAHSSMRNGRCAVQSPTTGQAASAWLLAPTTLGPGGIEDPSMAPALFIASTIPDPSSSIHTAILRSCVSTTVYDRVIALSGSLLQDVTFPAGRRHTDPKHACETHVTGSLA